MWEASWSLLKPYPFSIWIFIWQFICDGGSQTAQNFSFDSNLLRIISLERELALHFTHLSATHTRTHAPHFCRYNCHRIYIYVSFVSGTWHSIRKCRNQFHKILATTTKKSQSNEPTEGGGEKEFKGNRNNSSNNKKHFEKQKPTECKANKQNKLSHSKLCFM